HGRSGERPTASTKLSSLDGKTLYIFPTRRSRILRVSLPARALMSALDIVHQDSLRPSEEPASEPEHGEGTENYGDRLSEGRWLAQHEDALVGNDEVCERVCDDERL